MTVKVWVVLLEVADTRATGGITYESVLRLLHQLDRYHASGLWAPDRYAVQVVIQKEHPATAMDAAVTMWEEACTAVDLPGWELVRAECKTVGELQAELAAEAELMGTVCPAAVEAPPARPADVREPATRGAQSDANGVRCSVFTPGRARYPMS